MKQILINAKIFIGSSERLSEQIARNSVDRTHFKGELVLSLSTRQQKRIRCLPPCALFNDKRNKSDTDGAFPKASSNSRRVAKWTFPLWRAERRVWPLAQSIERTPRKPHSLVKCDPEHCMSPDFAAVNSHYKDLSRIAQNISYEIYFNMC